MPAQSHAWAVRGGASSGTVTRRRAAAVIAAKHAVVSGDVVMMRPTGRFGWARIGTRLTLQGLARRSPLSRKILQQTPDLHALAYVQGTRFEARFDAPHLIELDGDSFGHITSVRVSVRPGTLHVRVAAETNSVEKGTAARQRPSRL